MTSSERDQILAVFIEQIGNLERAIGVLGERMDSAEGTIEDIRRNAKGANNWGKIAAAVGGIGTPLLMAFLRAHGFL